MKTTKLPKQMMRLASEFKEQLEATKVDVERILPGKLYRFAVTSPKFAKVAPLRRQDRVWKIVGDVLEPAEQLKISLVLAYTPDEVNTLMKQGRRKGARRASS